ncbi:hypothetical protein M405DRAFT_820740, partial [Rhizopogon salebrosus TDB-379]
LRPSYTPSDLPALSYYDIRDTSSSDASLCSVNVHSHPQEAQILLSARTQPTPGKLISTMHSPDEPEKQWWRNIAKEWYAQGLAVQPPSLLIQRVDLHRLWAVL